MVRTHRRRCIVSRKLYIGQDVRSYREDIYDSSAYKRKITIPFVVRESVLAERLCGQEWMSRFQPYP